MSKGAIPERIARPTDRTNSGEEEVRFRIERSVRTADLNKTKENKLRVSRDILEAKGLRMKKDRANTNEVLRKLDIKNERGPRRAVMRSIELTGKQRETSLIVTDAPGHRGDKSAECPHNSHCHMYANNGVKTFLKSSMTPVLKDIPKQEL